MPANIYTTTARAEVFSAVFRGVFGWMAVGLGLTAVVAWQVASSQAALEFIFGNSLVLIGLIVAQLALVFVLAGRITSLAPSTAAIMFLAYSGLTGVTLSAVLLAYTAASVVQAFLSCAAMFGVMSIYGYTTKKDLASWGSFLLMGLVGVIVASLVNIFLASAAMDFVISVVGVLVFVGLTAYDVQRIKTLAYEIAPQGDLAAGRIKIYGALALYLDFINLFLMLLRLMGSRR